jgi:hypothetical protein
MRLLASRRAMKLRTFPSAALTSVISTLPPSSWPSHMLQRGTPDHDPLPYRSRNRTLGECEPQNKITLIVCDLGKLGWS